ncbi:hypothetical protein A3F37_03195 [Candidatus Saccharibacteria bacterium RIFCSPHIGHO2_12_FULL_41_12]|nr:MAG: hypothetical protein A3F37_03195 [Candidatus Saccharibacteria bacterium RIFCSPHIGHO2_12_FULL_41_12]
MTLEFQFIAGEFLVSKKKWEVPHLMEHMLLGANDKYPKARLFQQEFEKNGAYCNASTGAYGISYVAECADFEWERITDLLLLAITKPKFLEQEYKGEYGNVEEELISRNNNYFRQLSLAMRKKYGLCAETDKHRIELMKNIELKDIVNHYKKTHSASNMRFIVAGNIPPGKEKKIKNMIDQAQFASEIGRIELPDEMPKMLKTPLVIENKTVENLHFYIDIIANKPIKKPSERRALGATNHLLTGTLYSRILGEARERGWAYSLSSDVAYNKDFSIWWFGGQISRKNIGGIFDLIVKEIKDIEAGNISDEEIEQAKEYALGSFQRGAQTVGSIANSYSWKYCYENSVIKYDKIPELIKGVTKEQCVSVARKILKDKTWSIGFLGTADKELVKNLESKIQQIF